MSSWPVAHLDPVGRLRILAAGLPGAVVDQRTIDAPFERVWGFFSDMEASLPRFDQAVGSFQIVKRAGSRLVARARTPRLHVPVTFDVDLEPGWCWMTARPSAYIVGFAAQPDGDRTRFAHLEAYTLPGPPGLRALVRPLLLASRRHLTTHVRGDVDGIEMALGLRSA
jgi:hypothetical protein